MAYGYTIEYSMCNEPLTYLHKFTFLKQRGIFEPDFHVTNGMGTMCLFASLLLINCYCYNYYSNYKLTLNITLISDFSHESIQLQIIVLL